MRSPSSHSGCPWPHVTADAASSLSKTKTKAQAIRDYLAKHPNAKPQEVVNALRKRKIAVKAKYVSHVKSNSEALAKAGLPAVKSTSIKQWTFPKNTLEDAIRIERCGFPALSEGG